MPPEEAFTAAAFQRLLNSHKLMGSRCQRCNVLYLPPRPLCSACHGAEMAWQELKGEGEIAGFTSIAIVPTFMAEQGFGRDNPYLTAVVQLAEGPRISARLLGLDAKAPGSVKIGTPVRAVFLEQGEAERKKVVLAFRPRGDG